MAITVVVYLFTLANLRSVLDGERYELHLCEDCFFQTLAYLKQERRTQNLFSEDGQDFIDDLGLVAKDDYFGDAGSR